MRRASNSLLSHITRPTRPRLISRYLTEIPINQNQSPLSPTNLKPHHNGLLFFNSINTLAETPPPPLPSRQRKIKQKTELEEEFESATTTESIIAAFKAMESVFDENDTKLGLACLKVGLHMDKQGEQPDKIMEFGNRALNIFDKNDRESLPVAMTLHLLGSACYNMKRFSDGLGYFNRGSRVLGRLELEGYKGGDIRPVMHAVQLGLANTKTALGRREEALVHHKECLKIKELSLEGNSKEIGIANRELAEAYVAVLNFKDALPHCLKALEIHKGQLGDNSVEVAHDRRLLAVVYTGMEEHEKALEQNGLSKTVLKNWGLSEDLLRAEVDAANMQISLGKYEEAINTLKGVVQQTDKESKLRVVVLVAMANAFCNQEKFADSKRCLELSCGVLDKKEGESPTETSEAYLEIAMLYETMNEFETAITLYKRTLSILEKLPQEQHSEGTASARLGWLLLLTGRVPQAIQYLENGAERLKESFGPKHFGVGYIYNNLGSAYLELDRPESAAHVFAAAKEIMDVSLGPHHADSIEACQNLSKAYAAMKSYPLAMEFQQRVIDAWANRGPSAEDDLREAYRLLEQLKKQAQRSKTDGASSKALPPPLTSESVSGRR